VRTDEALFGRLGRPTARPSESSTIATPIGCTASQLSIVRNGHLAEEVLQETMLAVEAS
jgi:hypothetical protein